MNEKRRPGPRLVFALSGLGKSTLAALHPEAVFDADVLLYRAVEAGFSELEPRARLRAWRALCRERPWTVSGERFERWVRVRRTLVESFRREVLEGAWTLVLTSWLEGPCTIDVHYGVTRGRYLEHLRCVGRSADNAQDEAMNDKLEGYSPVLRLEPGSYLAEQPAIADLLGAEG